MNKEKAYAARMNRVCEYISQHLDEEMTLEKLSNVSNFSKYHFHRQFTAYIGITVFKYIQLMRLKRASYSLAFDVDLPIIEIAYEAQYESPESFSRAFKTVFEQTPSQFRKNPEWSVWRSKFQFSLTMNEELQSMSVKIVDFKEEKVGILEHRGAPDKVLDTARKFIEWRKTTGLSPVNSSKTYGIAYDDPETTEPDKFRFDICGSISSTVPENSQSVKGGIIPGGRCAVIRHLGSHDNLGESIYYLYREWLPKSGEETRDYPRFFHYLNLIPFVQESELITDIYLPIK